MDDENENSDNEAEGTTNMMNMKSNPVPKSLSRFKFRRPTKKKSNVSGASLKRNFYQKKLAYSSANRSVIRSKMEMIEDDASEFQQNTNLMIGLHSRDRKESRYQSIVTEMISKKTVALNTVRSNNDEVKTTSKQNELDIMRPNMFFFENENPNQIVQVKIGIKDRKKQTLKTINSALESNRSNFTTNYGKFWFLHPKRWNEIDQKYKNQTFDGISYENMATNSVLVKLLKKQNAKKPKINQPKPVTENRSQNEVQNLEKDLIESLGPDQVKNDQFLHITQAMTQNMIRRRSKINESYKIDVE